MRHLRPPPPVGRMLHYVGRRGAFLTFLALLDVVLGLSLQLPLPYGLTAPQVYGLFTRVAPITTWANVWTCTGILCATAALWYPARPAAFMLAAAIKTLWGLIYLAAWATGNMPRGYLSASVWLTFAALVLLISGWRENRPKL